MTTPKAMGSEKPGIVAVTVLLAVAITDTVPATVPAASLAFEDGEVTVIGDEPERELLFATGCADFPLPVLHGRASLAVV